MASLPERTPLNNARASVVVVHAAAFALISLVMVTFTLAVVHAAAIALISLIMVTFTLKEHQTPTVFV